MPRLHGAILEQYWVHINLNKQHKSSFHPLQRSGGKTQESRNFPSQIQASVQWFHKLCTALCGAAEALRVLFCLSVRKQTNAVVCAADNDDYRHVFQNYLLSVLCLLFCYNTIS